MEIQSFILGMGAVLVIAAVIVGVVAFFKVIKLNSNFNEQIKDVLNTIHSGLDDVDSRFIEKDRKIENVYTEFNRKIENVYSDIDSRCDKLKSVISKEIENAVKQKNN